MILRILPEAQADLLAGYHFYENQQQGLGAEFYFHAEAEIDKLIDSYERWPRKLGAMHRMLTSRFPFAVYYDFDDAHIYVHAVVDCRQDPRKLEERF